MITARILRYHDTDPFLFYVMTELDEYGQWQLCHLWRHASFYGAVVRAIVLHSKELPPGVGFFSMLTSYCTIYCTILHHILHIYCTMLCDVMAWIRRLPPCWILFEGEGLEWGLQCGQCCSTGVAPRGPLHGGSQIFFLYWHALNINTGFIGVF